MSIEAIGGLRLHLQTLGARGSQVIMLHGMGASLATWYFSVAPAVARDHRVLLYDLRGHGLSEKTASGYGMSSMAADLGHVVDRVAGDAAVSLVGHSYGAVVALRFAIDHPRRVRRMVVVEAPLPMSVEVLDAVAISTETIAREVDDSVDAALGTLPAAQQTALKGSGRRRRRMAARASVLVHETSLMADLARESDIADGEIAACRCPVMLCYGTRTQPQMTSTCARLASLLPDVRVRTFDSGHLLPNEQPRLLAEAIGDFLDHG